MDGPAVAIIDRVTLGSDIVEGWLGRLRAEYAPGAERRGMRLAGTWWSYVGPGTIEVTVRWDVPDVRSFWAMRRAAGADPTVAAWWAATDAVATERHRSICSAS